MGYNLFTEWAYLFTYLHIILAALLPIYTGAHASLRCPSSAKAPEKKAKGQGIYDDDDELDEYVPEIQSLRPSHAITFPITAGLVLGSLYIIIKWLEDPKILVRILNWYFSGVGILGAGELAVDFLNLITTFIFPTVWSTKKEVYFIDSIHSSQLKVSSLQPTDRKLVEDKNNPFPGFMSSIRFPTWIDSKIWSVRNLFKNYLVFRGYIKDFLHTVKPVRLNDVIGFIFGFIVIFLYNFLIRPWWLTNLIGFGFCYGTLQLISPTTFWTGSLVLFGLFVYDITMVFYTPLMITVASSLDVPIKLVFPGPKKNSMLGLGDVILPGIMIALALRFDLYLHYYKKQKPVASNQGSGKNEVIKSEYIEPTGVWGERFWTSSLESKTLYNTVADGARFNKVYFWAGIISYVVGLILTLMVLHLSNHAQPALLYLVPTVLIGLWGTALIKGDITLMWKYNEDIDSEIESHIDRNDKKDSSLDQIDEKIELKEKEQTTKNDKDNTKVSAINKIKLNEKEDHKIFLFSLAIPQKRVEKIPGSKKLD
ncbi:putative intramembrane protease C25B8.17 [Golovinomyces cichoracearum]|uniref:Putative intramembrane protease C25B8.17 n=1 Tax=Golovinomyces cichoracearum TaxID=62708 RepID=A0A420HPI3_9PEZI|nr:putative intramembrane protease C25B8.17 [Golovinomyces cichoracearum]